MPANTLSDKLLTTEPVTWDSSPLTEGAWYFALERYLPDQDASFSTYIEEGWYVDRRGKTVVSSDQHLVIVKDQVHPTQHSFEDPSPTDPVEGYLALARTAPRLST